MNRTRIHWVWSLAVLALSVAFYLATSAWGPYVGLSAQFVAGHLFEGLPTLGVHPVEEVVLRLTLRLVRPDQAMAALSVLAALFGGLSVMGLFRAAVAGVKWSCLDMTGIRSHELSRAHDDLRVVMLMTGLGTALLGLVALPLWAQGTRPLPGGLSTTLGMALITFSLGLRRRCTEDLESHRRLTSRHQVLLCMVFALAAYLGIASPELAIVALLGVLLGGWVLLQPEIEWRLGYFLWAGLGLLAGAVGSLLTFGWALALSGAEQVPLLRGWLEMMTSQWLGVIALVTDYEQVLALLLFALPSALFFGCFPRAFRRFASPLLGQVVTFAVVGLCLAGWPEELWALLAEPTPLAALGLAMLLLVLGMTVGSWACNWLDVHTRWPALRAQTLAATGTLCVLAALAVTEGLRWHVAGAGRSAQTFSQALWSATDRALPPKATLWLRANMAGQADFLLWRYTQARPIYPMIVPGRWPKAVRFGERSLEACFEQDPVLGELRAEPEVCELYLLYSPWRSYLFKGTLPVADPEQLAALADWAAQTPFGGTFVGKRTIADMRARAARAAVERAYALPPLEAAKLLRQAVGWDPENKSAPLSLAALAAEEIRITDEECLRAVQIEEREPWILEPPTARAAVFEAHYGPVRNDAFRAAGRLRRLLQEDRERMIAGLCDVYRHAPDLLSPRERVIALLSLPEAEAGDLLSTGAPTVDDLELYLFAYPLSERSQSLYKRHQAQLGKHEALAQLYRTRYGLSRERMGERILSFFSRDGRFAYALFHTDELLGRGELDEAERFVTGFAVQERLADRPCQGEALRARVLEKRAASDPAAALATAREWLAKDPAQPTLWTLLLESPAQVRGSAEFVADLHHCLGAYPLHAVAGELFARDLAARFGDDAATRWREAMRRARAASMK